MHRKEKHIQMYAHNLLSITTRAPTKDLCFQCWWQQRRRRRPNKKKKKMKKKKIKNHRKYGVHYQAITRQMRTACWAMRKVRNTCRVSVRDGVAVKQSSFIKPPIHRTIERGDGMHANCSDSILSCDVSVGPPGFCHPINRFKRWKLRHFPEPTISTVMRHATQFGTMGTSGAKTQIKNNVRA